MLALQLGVASPAVAKGDALKVINQIRSAGCAGGDGGGPALKEQVRLNEVASINSGGVRLAESLRRAGYSAAHSTSIHVGGTGSFDDALERVLRLRFCADITDRRFSELGSARRGRDVWIVLARPFAAPAPDSAESIGQRMLRLVNDARSVARQCGDRWFDPAKPVRLNPVLAKAALAHARDMAAHERMAHAGSDGSTPAQRAAREGYKWRSVAENVAAGQETPEQALQAWLTSPGHCSNVMEARYTEMGVAYASNPSSEVKVFWAQLFAAPR